MSTKMLSIDSSEFASSAILKDKFILSKGMGISKNQKGRATLMVLMCRPFLTLYFTDTLTSENEVTMSVQAPIHTTVDQGVSGEISPACVWGTAGTLR